MESRCCVRHLYLCMETTPKTWVMGWSRDLGTLGRLPCGPGSVREWLVLSHSLRLALTASALAGCRWAGGCEGQRPSPVGSCACSQPRSARPTVIPPTPARGPPPLKCSPPRDGRLGAVRGAPAAAGLTRGHRGRGGRAAGGVARAGPEPGLSVSP